MTPESRDPQQLSEWFSSAAARLGELQERLAEEVRALRQRQAGLDAREEKLDEREADLRAAHEHVQALAGEAESRRTALDERESLIAGREEHLAARERELLTTRARLDDFAQQIRAAAERTQQRESELAERSAALGRCEEAIARFQGAFDSALRLVRRAPLGGDLSGARSVPQPADPSPVAGTAQGAASPPAGRAPRAATTPKPSAIDQLERALAEMKQAAGHAPRPAARRAVDIPTTGLDPLLSLAEMDQAARALRAEAADHQQG